MQKPKSLHEHLNDTLLAMSEENSSNSITLLEASGMDTHAVINSSLLKINTYKESFKKSLEREKTKSLLDNAKNRLNELLVQAPEKTNQFINRYLKQNAPSIQFQSKQKIDDSALDTLGSKVDLNDLVNKLENHKSFKKNSD